MEDYIHKIGSIGCCLVSHQSNKNIFIMNNHFSHVRLLPLFKSNVVVDPAALQPYSPEHRLLVLRRTKKAACDFPPDSKPFITLGECKTFLVRQASPQLAVEALSEKVFAKLLPRRLKPKKCAPTPKKRAKMPPKENGKPKRPLTA